MVLKEKQVANVKCFFFLGGEWTNTKRRLSVCFNLWNKDKKYKRNSKYDISARSASVLKTICDVKFDIELEWVK